MKRIFKKVSRIILLLSLCTLLFVVLSNRIVERSTKDNLYSNTHSIPKNKVGLLLGTSKYVRGGSINQYYKYRIEAAVRLFKSGKIDYILVSGDNGTRHYDEPTVMKKDLIAKGIPGNRIYLDYAGFRTLDSVVRSKAIFGQHSITIISQQFHNQRALFIADNKGINAIGYNAKDVSANYGYKTRLREKFARAKMVLDL
ncbi:MAG: YdcF family protein, partial [Bacteroidales bacterium]|nr:YdcF family protein [Bacteroidales bacterium]